MFNLQAVLTALVHRAEINVLGGGLLFEHNSNCARRATGSLKCVLYQCSSYC